MREEPRPLESEMTNPMFLLKKLAAMGLIGLISLVIGGIVLIVLESSGRGGVAKPMLVVRPIFLSQTFPAPEISPQAPGR